MEMLKEGWATTYAQAGADYGKETRDEFERIEAIAKYVHRPRFCFPPFTRSPLPSSSSLGISKL